MLQGDEGVDVCPMPNSERAYFIVPSGFGKPCVHYFVTNTDGARFCAACGRYEDTLLRERVASRPPEPAVAQAGQESSDA